MYYKLQLIYRSCYFLVFICAEVGVNFRNLNEADEIIRECASTGVDAVKFQVYKAEHVAGHSRAKELENIILDETAIRYLYWRGMSAGVEFMATPFYSEAIPVLDPYVNRWKIRYKDRENEAIIAPCRATGKPMLISGKNVYCVPEYPPGIEHTFISQKDLEDGGFNGYSSHIPKIPDITPKDFFEYLEVHVKRDHYPDNYCPIDNAVSITMSELKELCKRLK
jgi:hypothetical protein